MRAHTAESTLYHATSTLDTAPHSAHVIAEDDALRACGTPPYPSAAVRTAMSNDGQSSSGGTHKRRESHSNRTHPDASHHIVHSSHSDVHDSAVVQLPSIHHCTTTLVPHITPTHALTNHRRVSASWDALPEQHHEAPNGAIPLRPLRYLKQNRPTTHRTMAPVFRQTLSPADLALLHPLPQTLQTASQQSASALTLHSPPSHPTTSLTSSSHLPIENVAHTPASPHEPAPRPTPTTPQERDTHPDRVNGTNTRLVRGRSKEDRALALPSLSKLHKRAPSQPRPTPVSHTTVQSMPPLLPLSRPHRAPVTALETRDRVVASVEDTSARWDAAALPRVLALSDQTTTAAPSPSFLRAARVVAHEKDTMLRGHRTRAGRPPVALSHVHPSTRASAVHTRRLPALLPPTHPTTTLQSAPRPHRAAPRARNGAVVVETLALVAVPRARSSNSETGRDRARYGDIATSLPASSTAALYARSLAENDTEPHRNQPPSHPALQRRSSLTLVKPDRSLQVSRVGLPRVLTVTRAVAPAVRPLRCALPDRPRRSTPLSFRAPQDAVSAAMLPEKPPCERRGTTRVVGPKGRAGASRRRNSRHARRSALLRQMYVKYGKAPRTSAVQNGSAIERGAAAAEEEEVDRYAYLLCRHGFWGEATRWA